MSKKDAKDIISSYRKKQKLGPYIIGGVAILLAVAGIVLLVIYLVGGGSGMQISLFKSKTPTPTETPTPTPVTPTATATLTATPTLTPTITLTPTPSGPFEYEVQEGDNCFDIAAEFEVDVEVLLALNNLGGNCLINPGDIILIPTTDQELPTATPLPTDLAPGTLIQYTVRLGDTLSNLADQFFSTVDRIIEETNEYRLDNDLDELEDKNDIKVGDILVIPYLIATPVPTSTSTPAPTATP
jgi:LysM repeat protein